MKKMLTNNWSLKLMALLVAFLLWLIVVNVSDPDIMKTFTNIEVQIENEQVMTDAGLYYEVTGGNRATVVLKGPRSVLNSMTSENIKAVADLRNLSSTNSVEIEYSLNVQDSTKTSQIEFVSKTISMWFDVEKIVTKTYPVQVIISGTPAEGYVVDSYSAEIEEIDVTAPESVHDMIDHMGLSVNVDGISEDMVADAVPVMVTESDTAKSMNSSTTYTNFSTVSVSVGIAYTKDVPIRYSLEGEAAGGYEIISDKADKGSVCLIGDRSILDGISEIIIPADRTDVSGIRESTEYTIDLSEYVPEGIAFYDADRKQKNDREDFVISVTVEPLVTNSYLLRKANILLSNTPKNCAVDFSDDSDLTVYISGLSDAFSEFDFNSDVRAFIDCENVTTETTQVPLRLEILKDGLVMQGDIMVGIMVRPLTETGGTGEEETTPQESTTAAETEN